MTLRKTSTKSRFIIILTVNSILFLSLFLGAFVKTTLADTTITLDPANPSITVKNIGACSFYFGNTPYGEIQQVANSSDTLYAITSARALLKSTDYQHWQLLSEDVLSDFPDYINLNVCQGILVTSDNIILLSFFNSTHSLILAGNPSSFIPIISTNNGELQNFEYNGLGGLVETNNHTLFLGVYGEANGGLIYKSSDHGITWTLNLNATQFLIDQGAYVLTKARHIHDIFYDETDNRVVAVVGEAVGDSFTESIIFTDDLGANWSIVEFRDYSFLGMEAMTCGTTVGDKYVIGDDCTGKTFISVYDRNFKYVNTLWEYDTNFKGQNFMDGQTFGNFSYFAGQGNTLYNALYVTDGDSLGRIMESDTCEFYTISSLNGNIGVIAKDRRAGDFLLIVFSALNPIQGLKALDYSLVNSNSEALIAPQGYIDNIRISFEDYSNNFSLIAKDDFEYSGYYSFLGNWSDNSGSTMNLISSSAYNGTQSLRYSSANPNEPSRFVEGRNWVPANLSTGTRVIIGYAVKVDKYNPVSDYTSLVFFRFNNTDGTTQLAYTRWHCNTTGWLLISQEYVLTKDVNAVQIYRIFGESSQQFNLDYVFIGYLNNFPSNVDANFFTGLFKSQYAIINGTAFPIINGEVTLTLNEFVSSISISPPKFGMFKISYSYNSSAPVPLSMRFVDASSNTLFSVYYDEYPSKMLLNVSISGGQSPYIVQLFYNDAPLTTVQSASGNFTYEWTVPNQWIGDKFTVILTGSVTDSTGASATAQPYLVIDPLSESGGEPASISLLVEALAVLTVGAAVCLSVFAYVRSRKRKRG